jgi:outer membrane receptor protein involved in Fe transport
VKQNISKAQLYGFEISGEHQITPGTRISFSASSVRGENTALHTNLPFIPPLHGSLGIRSTADGIGMLNLSTSFSADQPLTAPGEKRTAGYVVFDVEGVPVPIRTEGFSLTIVGGIRNIFNRAYHNHLSTVRGTNREAPGRDFFLSVTVTK